MDPTKPFQHRQTTAPPSATPQPTHFTRHHLPTTTTTTTTATAPSLPPPPPVPPRPSIAGTSMSFSPPPIIHRPGPGPASPQPQLPLSPSAAKLPTRRRTSVSQQPHPSPPHPPIRPRFSSQNYSTPPPPPPPKPPKPNPSLKPPTPFHTRSPTIPSRTPHQHPAGPRDWPSNHVNSPTHRFLEGRRPPANNLSTLFSEQSPSYNSRKQPPPDFTSLSIKKRISLTANLGLGLHPSALQHRTTRLEDSDDDEDDDEDEDDQEEEEEINVPRPPLHHPSNPPYPTSQNNDTRHLPRALSGSWLQSPVSAGALQFDPNHHRRAYEPIGKVEDIPDPTFANRRPPCLNPPVSISIGSQFTSWALRGNWLCTGHHLLKLWHTGTGESLSTSNGYVDTKITSMEFKTSTFQGNEQKTSENNSRYVWCGTKDGQVFEYDCLERRVTETRTTLHSAPVVGLFRCQQGGMCSIDESSKVQIWSNNLSSSSVNISGVARTQRIADKTNFTKMICHRLWTASGPSGSKTASTPSQRGPSIRVYDPDLTQAWTVTPRPITIPEAVIGGVMVGMVTAGAVVPARPELVFLGHESGHVSVWETRFQNRPLKPTTSQLDPPIRNQNHISSSSSSSSSTTTTTTTTTPTQKSQDQSLLGRSKSSHSGPSSTSPNPNITNGAIKFKKLIKLSNFQITSMEGVTKYLWVGFRTGFVYVYEPEIESPNVIPHESSAVNHNDIRKANMSPNLNASSGGSWKVLKLWRAHKESVLKIIVDPSLLWDPVGKLHVATTSTDWKIKLWDGTMSVDWLATEMRKRQTEYCTYRPIKALICSWNVDACKPNELTGTTDNLNFLEDVLKSSFTSNDNDLDQAPQQSNHPTPSNHDKFPTSFNHRGHVQNSSTQSSANAPDLIVFGFQEMIDLENKKLTAKTVLLGGRKKTAGTNGGNSAEKLSDSVSQVYRKWHDKLVLTVKTFMPPDDPYVVIHTENLVGLFTCVFVKSSERAKMRDIAVTTVKTGMKGRYGNKGAILARLVIDDSSICFINCHLAAGHKHVRQRNSDLIDILEEKSGFPDPPENKNGQGVSNNDSTNGVYVGGGNGSSISDHEICFLQGDLNYRIDSTREDVIRAIAAGEYCKLLKFDQLIKEKKTNPLFRLRAFHEPPIRFHPTYKYDPGTHMYDSSEKARVPAWCDRILYRTPIEETTIGSPPTIYIQQESSTSTSNSGRPRTGGTPSSKSMGLITMDKIVENINYRRYEVNISDHRPISATYQIFVKSIVPGLKRNVIDLARNKWKVHEAQIIADSRRYYSRL